MHITVEPLREKNLIYIAFLKLVQLSKIKCTSTSKAIVNVHRGTHFYHCSPCNIIVNRLQTTVLSDCLASDAISLAIDYKAVFCRLSVPADYKAVFLLAISGNRL
jgi:hypothetical protein